MKRKFLLPLFCLLLLFSCKKDINVNDEKFKVTYYENSPDNIDGLLAEVMVNEKNAKVYFYGTSNRNGEPQNIKSIAYKINNNDTIVNIVLDDQKRPQLIYFTTVGGINLNEVTKFEYDANDSIILSIYRYNWNTNTHSLIFQSKGKNESAIKTYGARYNVDIEFTKIVKTLVITVGAAALMATAVAAVSTTLFLIAGFGIAKSALAAVVIAASFVASANTNQEINPNTNLNAPTSPTDGFVPDPKGTATNPTGKITLTDIDGNIYHAVRIGTQTWMLENLKTARYNDGTAIPNVTDDKKWYEYGAGNEDGYPAPEKAAWSYYDNDVANNNIYGKLYNWHAVSSGKLAPIGWHVPTKAEWETLINYLGGNNIAGGKMKSTSSLWNSPNAGATNSSGFTALPHAWRTNHSYFNDIGNSATFWSITQDSSNDDWAWAVYLVNTDGTISMDPGGKEPGLAIRCIKD